AGHSMRVLGPEDLLVVLSAHAAKHVWERLIWLCDLARLVSSPSMNWERVWLESERLGIVRILQVSILLAHRMLGATPPVSMPRPDSAAFTLADEVQAHIESQNKYDVESPSYFALMMRLRERPVDRARFLTRLIFTPGPGEWSAVRLPRPLFPLY